MYVCMYVSTSLCQNKSSHVCLCVYVVLVVEKGREGKGREGKGREGGREGICFVVVDDEDDDDDDDDLLVLVLV